MSAEGPVDCPFTFDGEAALGREGEPLAVALVRAGYTQLTRSPKFHRPRGPACLRGGCDGCAVRVDGLPSVLSCLHPLTRGAVVESQNRGLARSFDPLRGADFSFPSGFNHHDFLAGVPIAGELLNLFARRVAGLGVLPDEAGAVRPGEHRTVDVLVVGAGPFGLTAAASAAAAGREVLVVDDAVVGGGVLRAAPLVPRPNYAGPIATGTTCVGLFDGASRALLLGPDGASLVTPRVIVLAPGGHDAVIPCADEDRPGVYAARAAGILLAAGVPLAAPVLLAPRGLTAIGRAVAAQLAVTPYEAPVAAVLGLSGVTGVRFENGEEIPASTVIVDLPPAPAHELLAAAGFPLRFAGDGYTPVGQGALRSQGAVHAIGGAIGAPLAALPETAAALTALFA